MLRPNKHHIDFCNRALEGVSSRIPEPLFREVHDYINKYGEWGLGLEILIEQISEYEIKIALAQYRLIEQAMASMGLGDSAELQYLREHDVVD